FGRGGDGCIDLARDVHGLGRSRIRPSGPRLHNPLERVRRPRLPPDSAPIQTSWSGTDVPLRGADAVVAKDRRKTARNSRAGSLVTGDLGENGRLKRRRKESVQARLRYQFLRKVKMSALVASPFHRRDPRPLLLCL